MAEDESHFMINIGSSWTISEDCSRSPPPRPDKSREIISKSEPKTLLVVVFLSGFLHRKCGSHCAADCALSTQAVKCPGNGAVGSVFPG